MKQIVAVSLMLTVLWTGVVFSAVQTEVVEVRGGTVEHWFAAERVVMVARKRYRLADDAEILNGNGKALGTSTLRSGGRVLLIENEGEVGSITTDPRTQFPVNRQAR